MKGKRRGLGKAMLSTAKQPVARLLERHEVLMPLLKWLMIF